MHVAEDQAADVRTLLDKQAIAEMLHRYCYAMDANDRQLGYEVWHADGTAHYEGMFDGLGRDFVDFGQSGHEAAFGQTSHQLTNILIEVAGDRATSRSCVTAAAPIANSDSIYIIRGRYHDQWSRPRRRLADRQPTLHDRHLAGLADQPRAAADTGVAGGRGLNAPMSRQGRP